MKTLRLLCFLVLTISEMTAQLPNVPENIKAELEIKQIEVDGRNYPYAVDYPENYDPQVQYEAMVCLGGGSFSTEIAYYYHYCYAPRASFKDFIKIYLISPRHKSVLSFDKTDWVQLIPGIERAENLKPDNWVISGASNGGIATYDLIAALPDKFMGFITIPGSMGSHAFLKEWVNYKVLMVYMENDPGWTESTKRDFKKLKQHIDAIDIYEIKDQGHILPPSFDIEPIYQRFLKL